MTKTLYSAFDLHPSSKGASTHITHFSKILESVSTQCTLFSIGSSGSGDEQMLDGILHRRFKAEIPNYLHRAEEFGRWLMSQLKSEDNFDLAHYRDIWSAIAVLSSEKAKSTVFEVNGLPSIELPFRYSSMSKKTLDKLVELEAFCLEKSDQIVVPAKQIKDCLIARGLAEEKITLISNGADIPKSQHAPDDFDEPYLMYFGALQAWQGLDDLMRAFALLRDYDDLVLLICCSNPEKHARPYKKLAEKLDIDDRIEWRYQLEKPELNRYIQNALFTVAPLKDCDRNIQQGCCPLKALESMACATPVVATSVPAIEEINSRNQCIKLSRPDRPADLARAMRSLIEFPKLREELAHKSLECVQQAYTWEQKAEQLKAVYNKLL